MKDKLISKIMQRIDPTATRAERNQLKAELYTLAIPALEILVENKLVLSI